MTGGHESRSTRAWTCTDRRWRPRSARRIDSPDSTEDPILHVRRFADAPALVGRAGGWLEEREAEHNLIFGICSTLAEDPSTSEGPPLLATVEVDGTVVAVALRTPPWNVVLSEVDDPAALGALAAHLATDPLHGAADVPGVIGPAEHATRFARLWAERTGALAVHDMTERIFRLTTVRRPWSAPGSKRTATHDDRALLVGWFSAFHREAFGRPMPTDDETMADRWLTLASRTMWLWEVAGDVVSMCGWGGQTPNGIRIGPVYTPPRLRGRGYASTLVAEASQAALDAGRRFCFLLTDLANPTSNHIYREIGYEQVRDMKAYMFSVAR